MFILILIFKWKEGGEDRQIEAKVLILKLYFFSAIIFFIQYLTEFKYLNDPIPYFLRTLLDFPFTSGQNLIFHLPIPVDGSVNIPNASNSG